MSGGKDSRVASWTNNSTATRYGLFYSFSGWAYRQRIARWIYHQGYKVTRCRELKPTVHAISPGSVEKNNRRTNERTKERVREDQRRYECYERKKEESGAGEERKLKRTKRNEGEKKRRKERQRWKEEKKGEKDGEPKRCWQCDVKKSRLFSIATFFIHASLFKPDTLERRFLSKQIPIECIAERTEGNEGV